MTRQDAYIIEFLSLGNALKVTAVDPETGHEVSLVGDPQTSRQELSRLAAIKLDYVLRKRKKPQSTDKGPGIVV